MNTAENNEQNGFSTTHHEPLLSTTDQSDRSTTSSPSDSSDSATFHRLASLNPAQYDRARKKEARALEIRVETLDAEVSRYRSQFELDAALNSALSTLHSPEPWPEPIDGQHSPTIAQVLDRVSARYSLYIVLPPGAADALALWTAQSHTFSAFLQSPRLSLSSPKEGCGKTTVLDVLASMTPRPLRTENLTAPVLFRIVDQRQPTLLLDEVDTYLHQANELRGLLNAGHKRGGCAYRCEGDGNAVRAFRAFAPAALAGIGSLPATLHDRSIHIPLVEAEPGQIPARFDGHRLEIETDLCRQLARWAADNLAALQSCDPPLPPTAYNRLADNWRPLFAIAQLAGADWLDRALSAFNSLTVRTQPVRTIPTASPIKSSAMNGASSQSALSTENSRHPNSSAYQPSHITHHVPNVHLLSAIRDIFNQTGLPAISSKDLADLLRVTLNSSLPITNSLTPASLARHLIPFGIHSCTIRLNGRVGRGYKLADCAAAFAQFLNNGSHSS